MGGRSVFKQLSNVWVNRMRNDLAAIVWVNKDISYLMARHTFGTMLVDKTNEPYLIKSLMGHSKIETSLQYIHESAVEINQKLAGVKW